MNRFLFVAPFAIALFSASVALAQDSTVPSKMPDTGRRKVTYPGYKQLKTFGGRKQFSEWSVGVNAGATMPYSPLGGRNEFAKNNFNLGYGGFLKWQIQHSFGLRADYMGGKVGGKNIPTYNSAIGEAAPAGTQFTATTKLTYVASIKGELDVASIDFLRRKNAVRLFITAGYGLAGFKPNAGDPFGDNNNKSLKTGFIPVGTGVKFRLSEGLALNLGYDLYIFNDGNLYTPARYSAIQSKMGFGYGGLEYTFGGSRAKALVWNNPVSVLYDELKNNDSLEHVIADLRQNQTTTQSQVTKLNQDTDGDGVSDAFDKCPNTTPGTKVDGSGCDLPKPEIIRNTTVQRIVETDIQIVREAVRNLTFNTGKATIVETSFPYLDRLATLLNQKQNESLSLKGYTDNVGAKAANLQLSIDRAQAVKDYLVSKGVSSDRITAKGYGQARPIASNKTSRGRAKNRRVEFSLF